MSDVRYSDLVSITLGFLQGLYTVCQGITEDGGLLPDEDAG